MIKNLVLMTLVGILATSNAFADASDEAYYCQQISAAKTKLHVRVAEVDEVPFATVYRNTKKLYKLPCRYSSSGVNCVYLVKGSRISFGLWKQALPNSEIHVGKQMTIPKEGKPITYNYFVCE